MIFYSIFFYLHFLYSRLEVSVIRKTAVYRAVNEALYYISGKLMIFLTLLTYVYFTDNSLTPDKAIQFETVVDW